MCKGRYNAGRDYLVGNLTGQTIDTRQLTNQTTFVGNSTYNNYTYQTEVKYVSGLLQNSSGAWCDFLCRVSLTSGGVADGVNHYLT